MKAIQAKIITLLICCTFLVVVAMEFVGLAIMNRALNKDSVQIMKLMCAEQTGQLNEYLHSVEQSVNTMHQVAMDGLGRHGEALLSADNGTEEKEVLLSGYNAEIEAVAKALADNTEGAIAVYYRFNPELFAPTAGFFSVKREDGTFERFPTTDLSLYERNDKEHVFWYYEPVNAGKAVWLNPYSNDNIGVEMISYVAPVFYNGEEIGIVGMDIDIVSWRERISAISLYKTGFAVLLDSEGNIIYHPEYKNGVSAEKAPEIANLINYHMEESLQHGEGYAYELDAQKRAMVASKLDNGMNFAVVVPLSEISAPSRQLMIETVFLAVGLVIAFSLFSVRICKKIITVAYTDVMTGAKNKTAYEEVVENINQEIRDKTAEFALIMFDINNLKSTNDTYGHAQGDTLIITAVELMKQVFGKENVFRIGGDEFVILLQHELAGTLKQRLSEFVRQLEKLNGEKKFIWGDIQMARGATSYDYRTDKAYGDVFRRADALMYQDKQNQKKREYI